MYKTAFLSGGLGDAVYQIPAMKELGVGKVYIPDPFYGMLARLMKYEGFEVAVPTDYRVHIDYIMDRFREQPYRGKNHIMLSIANQFKTTPPDFTPWLSIPPTNVTTGYNVIQVTPRWREGSTVNWQTCIPQGKNYFVGLQHEYEAFNRTDIGWWQTQDIYDLARVVAGADKVYCNQSVVMALAQAMGKEYYGEFKPGKTNCRTYKPNEHCL